VTHATTPDGHPAHLAHHFETPRQQYEAGKLGMWLFLATEILLFGGLFCAYAVYRANHPEIFVYAHRFLDVRLGAINTVVLICSSLTMALAVRCAQCVQRRGLIVCLALTFLCGGTFLGIKYAEYRHKWKEGLLWGTRYHPSEEHEAGTHAPAPAAAPASRPQTSAPTTGPEAERSKIAPAAVGPSGLAPWVIGRNAPAAPHAPGEPRNVQIFFGIYFSMTGLHGLHVIAGMTVLAWLLVRAIRGDFAGGYFTPVDLGGLYWHLVDLIWIYLFPLLYLIH
jgi:cytochrome c oxidase subunit 3